MVWYGMVWYGMVWYGMVWYGMVGGGARDEDSELRAGLGFRVYKGLGVI